MQSVYVACIITILVAIVVKCIFWFQIKHRQSKLLLRSFIRFYSIYDMHDASSPQMLTFWKISNYCNIAFYIAFITLLIVIYINTSFIAA